MGFESYNRANIKLGMEPFSKKKMPVITGANI